MSDLLALHFEANRQHLNSVARRLLSSRMEAEDAVQETWLRLNRTDVSAVDNLPGWLTAVVARVCLDMLRARKLRREEPESFAPMQTAESDAETAADRHLYLADDLGPALLVVLETLTPTERIAFVLHDVFEVSFEDISEVSGCSPEAARQLASRARRRVRRATSNRETDSTSPPRVLQAFLLACRTGDVAKLLTVLAPDVVLRADRVAVAASTANRKRGAPKLAPEVHGAASVADSFAGRAGGAIPALIDGRLGTVWMGGRIPRAVFQVTFASGLITAIQVIADAEHIRRLEVVLLSA